jgi:hypothetical protein
MAQPHPGNILDDPNMERMIERRLRDGLSLIRRTAASPAPREGESAHDHQRRVYQQCGAFRTNASRRPAVPCI